MRARQWIAIGICMILVTGGIIFGVSAKARRDRMAASDAESVHTEESRYAYQVSPEPAVTVIPASGSSYHDDGAEGDISDPGAADTTGAADGPVDEQDAEFDRMYAEWQAGVLTKASELGDGAMVGSVVRTDPGITRSADIDRDDGARILDALRAEDIMLTNDILKYAFDSTYTVSIADGYIVRDFVFPDEPVYDDCHYFVERDTIAYGMRTDRIMTFSGTVSDELYDFIFGRCEKAMKGYDMDDFKITEITDEIFARMQGKSYPEGCTFDLDELRYVQVLHYGFDGEVHTGELVVNRRIAEDTLEIFKELFAIEYPIEKIRLIDEYDADDERSMEDNNSSAFNYRYIAETTTLSNHAKGFAIDINTLYNPYVYVRSDGSNFLQPVNAGDYVDRDKYNPYYIRKGDPCYEIFTAHGFTWGGDWKTKKDYQHFEYSDH